MSLVIFHPMGIQVVRINYLENTLLLALNKDRIKPVLKMSTHFTTEKEIGFYINFAPS